MNTRAEPIGALAPHSAPLWPSHGVPHHLLYSFRNDSTIALGEPSDGVVTVSSQLRPAARENAVEVQGYDETHMSVLEASAVSARLNALLASIPR